MSKWVYVELGSLWGIAMIVYGICKNKTQHNYKYANVRSQIKNSKIIDKQISGNLDNNLFK